MANESIRAAFERMWQHTVAKIDNSVSNIKPLVVTIDDETQVASHNAQQIYEYVQNGGTALLDYQEEMWPLTNATESGAKFASIWADETYIYAVYVNEDGSIESFEHPYYTESNGCGSDILVVTTEWDEENEYKASHTPKQIQDHIQSGGVAVLRTDDNFVYHLYYAGEEHTYFFHVDDSLTLSLCEINDARECSFTDQGLASWSSVETNLMRVITVDENSIPSMTSQEIYIHVCNGGRVVLKYNDKIYSLASCVEHSAYFNYYDETYRMYCVEIADNKIFEHNDYTPASENWVSEQIGSIDEALTEILKTQQSLIDSALPQAEGVEF